MLREPMLYGKPAVGRRNSVKKLLCVFLAGAGLIYGGLGTCATPGTASPLTGTWALNLAKSKYSPGPAPKSDTRTYVDGVEGVTVTVNVVSATGSVMSETSTYKYDGKDYPVEGNPNVEALSLKRVDPNTTEITQKRSGKAVGLEVRVISADGRVMTISAKGTNAKGVAFDRVAVYDKQ
jgi:hypothetical protein